jgi:S-DNA-T family DNA segregation ATPase FtsK/SpoIIIE
MAKKPGKPNTQKSTKRRKRGIISLLKDERTKILIALLFIGFAFLLLISQISFLFTWKTDQSLINNLALGNTEVTAENWAGKFGALLAVQTISRWFGLASIAFPFLITLLGIKMLRLFKIRFGRIFFTTLFIVFVVSIWLGYFARGSVIFGSGPGGMHGHIIAAYLSSLLGRIGTFLLLTIVTLGIFFFTWEKSLETIKKYLSLRLPFLAEKVFTSDAPFVGSRDESKNGSEADDNIQIAGDDDSDLVFETEFPQRERTSESGSFGVRTVSQDKSGDRPPDEEDDIQLTVERLTKMEEEGEILNTLQLEDYDPTLELSEFVLPPIELLEKHDSANSSVTNEELISNKNKIVETLGHYKIQIDKIKATIGPTVTLYEIVPAPGVRISKIKNLEDDIALNLSALGIRIIAPIPGRGTIGIEVPNQTPEIVSMRSLIAAKKFQESDFELTIALGKTISNETYVFDLAKMPHLLVAGATGQGKSVGLNAIIASLLYRKHPSQLKFVLIDPKKVELTLYSRLEKHYLAKIPDSEEAIITDTQKVIYTLNSLTIEMDQRYDLLKKAQVRNIREYNRKFIKRGLNPENGHRYMPYIVVVIDEFADLIMTAGREVETPLARLAQLARAIGIHLVIATQRPTTNIITGVIKANFPARIAFRVTSMIDSRTILDQPGANQLIGRGDLLFAPGSDLIRLQCAFIDIPELERITKFIGDQRAYPTPYFLPEYVDDSTSDVLDVDLSKRDNLFNDAARLVVAHQQGSTSLIQRKFSIGYNRAGRIVDQLEAAGIVGPFEGSKARQVLFPDEYRLEQFLNSLDS